MLFKLSLGVLKFQKWTNKKSEDSYFVCFLRYRQTPEQPNQ